MAPRPRVAVVGHVEWITFARVPHVPLPGEIVQATESWDEVGGSGAVAAVQLAKLAGGAEFFTALGSDELARRAKERLAELGVTVYAADRPVPQRRAWVHLDTDGERTITTIGERIVPRGDDDLPWERLADADAVYFTGGDAAALRAARRARRLVATPRAYDSIAAAGVDLDALVRSAKDPGEQQTEEGLDPAPDIVVATAGKEGGEWIGEDRSSGTFKAAELPGPRRDAYGAGDSFAAGFTFALAIDLPIEEALQLAARAGAHKLAGRAAYDGQLTAADL
ncbi:MAG TPA: PfkB family carbohydrate kinase [Solirubrobacteraceae bacterium]|nr:PfkB family carbohydrate kinase [Solirubrobacteraceae bacterium]